MRLSKDEYELLYKLQKCTSKRNNRPVLNGVHMSLTNVVNGDELVMIQGVGDVSGHSRAYLCQVNHS